MITFVAALLILLSKENIKIYLFLNLSAYIPTNIPDIIKIDDKNDRYVNFSFKNNILKARAITGTVTEQGLQLFFQDKAIWCTIMNNQGQT